MGQVGEGARTTPYFTISRERDAALERAATAEARIARLLNLIDDAMCAAESDDMPGVRRQLSRVKRPERKREDG